MTDFTGVKLVVWDLDGTLIDSYGVYAAILKEAAELSGLPMPSEQTIRHNFHGSLDQTIKDTFAMVDGADATKLLNDFLRVQEDYYREPEEHLFSDALGLVKRVGEAHIPQVIATNRAHVGRANASPRYLVEHSSLKQYITDIVCGDEAPQLKPNPAVLSKVSAMQGVSGDEILVVGDQFVDAQLARNLGARAVIINRSDSEVPHLAELGNDTSFLTIVASLDEVEVMA